MYHPEVATSTRIAAAKSELVRPGEFVEDGGNENSCSEELHFKEWSPKSAGMCNDILKQAIFRITANVALLGIESLLAAHIHSFGSGHCPSVTIVITPVRTLLVTSYAVD